MCRPYRILACLGALALCMAGAWAQQSFNYTGKWSVRFPAPTNGTERQAELDMADATASWRDFPQGKQHNNPCLTREHPVTVKVRSDQELVFVVNSSIAMPSCTDLQVKAHVMDANTLEGKFSDGRVIRLTRK